MQGVVVTLHIKQYTEYQLSVFNGKPEFLHTIQTFVAPRYKRCRESQPSVLNDTGSTDSPLLTIAESQSKIANISSYLKLNSKSLQKPSKGLGRSPFVKKSEANKSCWTVPLRTSRAHYKTQEMVFKFYKILAYYMLNKNYHLMSYFQANLIRRDSPIKL
jgi:hypothetical protein